MMSIFIGNSLSTLSELCHDYRLTIYVAKYGQQTPNEFVKCVDLF